MKYGDIIIEKSGGSKNQPVGRVVIFKRQNENFSFSNFTALLRIKPTLEINPLYLHYILHDFYLKGETEKFQTYTGGIRNLQLKQYLEISIPLPPLEVQEEIIAKIEEEEKAIEECKKLIETHKQKINEKIQSIWGNE